MATGRLIFLVGFVGCGKTTVGRALAQALGCRFLDTDDLVEAKALMTIEEIFARSGQVGFRELEWEALTAIAVGQRAVVATGAAVFLAPRHRAYLKQNGLTIWLDTPFGDIWSRVQQASRHYNFKDQDDLMQLFDRRRKIYAEADLHVVTGQKPLGDIVVEIRGMLKG